VSPAFEDLPPSEQEARVFDLIDRYRKEPIVGYEEDMEAAEAADNAWYAAETLEILSRAQSEVDRVDASAPEKRDPAKQPGVTPGPVTDAVAQIEQKAQQVMSDAQVEFETATAAVRDAETRYGPASEIARRARQDLIAKREVLEQTRGEQQTAVMRIAAEQQIRKQATERIRQEVQAERNALKDALLKVYRNVDDQTWAIKSFDEKNNEQVIQARVEEAVAAKLVQLESDGLSGAPVFNPTPPLSAGGLTLADALTGKGTPEQFRALREEIERRKSQR